MAEDTKIEWADHSWSPWRGCTKVSSGCLNCYAETLSKRNPAVLGSWGKGAPRVLAKNWGEPVKWNRRLTCDCGTLKTAVGDSRPWACPTCRSDPRNPRVFPSLCDWLDEEVPVEWLARFLQLVLETQHLDWLLLTKRPENWGRRIQGALAHVEGILEPDGWEGDASTPVGIWLNQWLSGEAPGNVWFGVSVENQIRVNQRIPLLMEIPARLRWLSVEPLIGPVDLSEWAHIIRQHHPDGSETPMRRPFDWVVVGGESGHGARPCNLDWIRNVVRECRTANVPVFVKQVGARPDFAPVQHPKGGDPAEWPEDIRVREYPKT